MGTPRARKVLRGQFPVFRVPACREPAKGIPDALYGVFDTDSASGVRSISMAGKEDSATGRGRPTEVRVSQLSCCVQNRRYG